MERRTLTLLEVSKVVHGGRRRGSSMEGLRGRGLGSDESLSRGGCRRNSLYIVQHTMQCIIHKLYECHSVMNVYGLDRRHTHMYMHYYSLAPRRSLPSPLPLNTWL